MHYGVGYLVLGYQVFIELGDSHHAWRHFDSHYEAVKAASILNVAWFDREMAAAKYDGEREFYKPYEMTRPDGRFVVTRNATTSFPARMEIDLGCQKAAQQWRSLLSNQMNDLKHDLTAVTARWDGKLAMTATGIDINTLSDVHAVLRVIETIDIDVQASDQNTMEAVFLDRSNGDRRRQAIRLDAVFDVVMEELNNLMVRGTTERAIAIGKTIIRALARLDGLDPEIVVPSCYWAEMRDTYRNATSGCD